MAERRQKRGKRRRGFVEIVNALLTLLVLAILVIGGLALYGAHSFYAPGPIKTDTNFVVAKGNNLGVVAERLEQQGLIDNRYIFQLGSIANRKQGQLKAGEFKLSANASMFDVLKQLTEGKPVQHGITIPEGFTIAQVVDRLNKDQKLTGDLTTIPPEGGILPQTYSYEPGVSRQVVLDQMVAAQQKALAEVWADRAPGLPISTPEEMVILASIVEKETGVATERREVAAVFMNRLKKRMRLQSDPTIIYGITKGEAPLGRPLRRAEVEAATPYNTYQIDGLPPTPIANPGIESLRAVANPDPSNAVYFVAVSTNPSDGHLFAATYAEHRKNVQKLRSAERAANANAEAQAAEDQLEAEAAAAAGDPSATAPDAGPDASAPGADAPGAPAALLATPPAPATTATPDAPMPMPASERPVAPPAAEPAAEARPPVRPTRPRQTTPAPQDIFGG